ncbi:MAG TPA: protein kinase, partial [Candidatus Bathyarchaeia archaeon]|nr:protein kinase [Candidatus Bathyarchaeia archaeon]
MPDGPLIIKNKYRILRQIAQGGMGSVYEVLHERLGVTRALKQVRVDLQGNPEAERRFLTEAQMMARLEHPNIVRVYDIDYEPDFGTFLLMELIRGPDLGKVLRKEGRLGLAETLRIGRGVARALDYAHRHQLVHRDIKPANVILEEGSGRVVVTDFGIAKQVESAENTLTSENTRTGAFLGTYRYSSREQIRNEKGVRIDGRADVYSLGAVLYEMYSGLRYLHGMSEPEITAFVGYQPNWTAPLEFPEPPPDDFRELIERCLATNRDERVASAAEVIVRLEACSARSLDPAARAIVLTDVDTPPIAAAPTGGGTVEGSLAGLSVGTQSTTSPAEPLDESRAQWVSLIQTLRESVDSQASDFERLLKELIELDIPRDEYRQLDDMSQILHRVESAEGAGEFASAASSLEDLSERLSGINAQIAERLRGTLSGAVEELERGWKALIADAGDFVPADQATQIERVLGSSQRLIASQNWAGSRKSLLDGTALLDRAGQGARQAATDAVGDAVRAIGARFAELTARSAESARGLGFEPAQVEKELAAAIAEGKMLVARRRAEEVLARVGDALGRVEGEERARIAKLRSELEALLARIDLGAARALAPADLESANEARRAAVRAEEAQQIGPALAAYARAIELFGAVRETLQQHQAAEITIAERELEAVVQRAGEAPTEVVAAPLDAARLALRGTRPTQHGAAVAALRDARATLAKALEEAPLFSEASAAETKAAALRDRLRAELEDPAVLGPGERRLAQGRAALARREWRGARDRFIQALESFRAFEGELGRRQLETRLASTRQAFSEELAAIDSPLAREHSKRALADVDRLAERARQSERAGDLDAAHESYEAARAALGKVRSESTPVLGRLLVELGEAWQRTGGAAGGFVEAAARGRIEPAIENARQALTRGALGEAARLLAESREQIDAELRDATRRASSLVEETVRSTRARLAELASRAPERAARLGVDPSSLEVEIAGLIGAQRLQAAADRAEQAATLVRTALEAQVRDEEAGELAEATHQLRVMLTEAAGAPAEIVAAAIRRTEKLLSGGAPAAHGEAMAALRGARSELARALDSASLYQAARQEQEAARAAYDRARDLAPSPGEIAPLEKLIADADARLERRNFRAARDGHAAAREQLAALERELLARRDAQQIEAARSGAARALAELEPAWARALVPEESARALRAAEAAAAMERAGDRRAAAAAFREAGELATQASGRIRALVEASLADLPGAWRLLAERAGAELIDEAESTEVLRALEDAGRALERGALAEAHQIELSVRARQKETSARVARGAKEATARALDELADSERKLRTCSEEVLRRTGVAFDTTRDEVTRLIAEARFADAIARARTAAATVAEALDRELAAERGRAAAARELLARALAGLDAPLAEQLAADDLGLVRGALGRGREAEESADYQGATREYTAGSAAAERVRAALAERAERDRAALAGIRGRFDQAFDALDLDWAREIAAD